MYHPALFKNATPVNNLQAKLEHLSKILEAALTQINEKITELTGDKQAALKNETSGARVKNSTNIKTLSILSSDLSQEKKLIAAYLVQAKTPADNSNINEFYKERISNIARHFNDAQSETSAGSKISSFLRNLFNELQVRIAKKSYNTSNTIKNAREQIIEGIGHACRLS